MCCLVVLWLVGPLVAPLDPTDLVRKIDVVRMIAAEDAFDVEADLSLVIAPTLVLGGAGTRSPD